MADVRSTELSANGWLKRRATWEGLRLEHCRMTNGHLPNHSHRQHVILLALSEGCKGEFKTASGSGLSGTQTRGAVCVVPAGLTHSATLEGASEHLALYLDPLLVQRAATGSKLSFGFEILEKYSRNDPVITSVGMALLGELESEGVSGRLYAESLANVLAVHLLRYYTAAGQKPERFKGGLPGPKLRQVMAFIADNYPNDIKLSELAQVAGMSSFHFAREFKRTTGTTPHQYLINFRIERAKALLGDEKLPLIEVGLRSGFSHQSHFTRLFRKFTGTTPHLYRLTLQS